ncbi:MaoC/PaaZ C-terminal domain-containing protein, partial [Frankia sp. AvcI1]
PYGATIAHGFLTASLVPYFMNKLRTIEGIRMGINYGLDRVRFPSPVRAGARIRARATLIDLRKLDDGAVQVTNRVTIDVDGSAKPGCVVELLARYYFADAAGS